MKKFKKLTMLLLSCLIPLQLFVACQPQVDAGKPDIAELSTSQQDSGLLAEATDSSGLQQDSNALTVALYPYVPDTERFKAAVMTEWEKVEPNIELNFVEWDCYENDPGTEMDVFVFDAIYLKDYIDKGYLLPLTENEIEEKDDIVEFALSGCRFDGNYYAIPQILCTNLLFTRKGDTETAAVNTVQDLYNVLGDSKASGEKPEPGEGLMSDLSGGTTKACLYIDAFIDHSQEYNGYFTLPNSPDFHTDALNYLKLLLKMTGKANAEYSDDEHPYIRGEWFRDGYGRACIGFAESMAVMGEAVNDMEFKLFSLCEHNNIPLFYSDVVGIGANSADKELAVKLANVVANAETMVMAVSPNAENESPQYLLPARHSVYNTLSKDFSIYTRLYNIVRDSNGYLFVISPDVNEWIESNKAAVKEALFEE